MIPPMTSGLRLAMFADPTETHTQRWARYFVGRGHHVAIIVRHDRPAPDPDPGGPHIIRMRSPRSRRRPARWFDLLSRVRGAVATVRPDVVHAHYLTSQGWMAWASGFRPYVITVWGSDVYLDLRSPKTRAIGGLALRGAALVTADSADLARAAVRAGARRSRTEIVQFGVDTHTFAPRDATALRARLAPRGERIVLSPRTILPLYRHELVVAAMAELPSDVVLVMTARGASPDALGAVRAAAARHGVDDRLHIEPTIPHERMAEYLNAADVIVSLPSSDATPVTVLEALACGTPAVVFDLPSLREWSAGLSEELLVRTPDATSVAAAIRRALALTPPEREALASRGRALVSQHADYERNMHRMEMRYLALAGRS
jgi:glycosyltransferase involved in cell wall biosynthesis